MTGMPDFNYPAFHAAAAKLRAAGYTVANPADNEAAVYPKTWEQYMRAAIKQLCECDVITVLPNWHDSDGAHDEIYFAHRLKIKHVPFEALLTHSWK